MGTSGDGLAGGRKLFIISAILVLATQCAGQSAKRGPFSRATGYTSSVDLHQPDDSPPRAPQLVLQTENFNLLLEADERGRCSLSLRRKYTGLSPWAPPNPGHLVWTANYYARPTPSGAHKCSLKFTKDGDLQLWVLCGDSTFIAWNSKTGGQGVAKMALETNPDNGNFKLVTASNEAVYSSFDVKEFAIVRGQQLRIGQALKSPDAVQVAFDAETQVLFHKGEYALALQKNGDLQLLMNGPKPRVYWSLKKSGLFKGDLSKVAYAAEMAQTGGIGLFTAFEKLVWGSDMPPPGYWVDTYFGIDVYGNLKDYYLYKGVTWLDGVQVIKEDCDLPNFCGDYGLCSKSKAGTSECSCPIRFTKVVYDDIATSSCKRNVKVAKCKRNSYLEFKGYDSVFNLYATPLKVTLASCKATCLSSCDCDGLFYHSKTGFCYKQTNFKTLKKVADIDKVAFIKI